MRLKRARVEAGINLSWNWAAICHRNLPTFEEKIFFAQFVFGLWLIISIALYQKANIRHTWIFLLCIFYFLEKKTKTWQFPQQARLLHEAKYSSAKRWGLKGKIVHKIRKNWGHLRWKWNFYHVDNVDWWGIWWLDTGFIGFGVNFTSLKLLWKLKNRIQMIFHIEIASFREIPSIY